MASIPWTHLFLPLAAGAALTLAACDSEEDDPVVLAQPQTCVLAECHGQVEEIHYGGPTLSCTDCHLGDGTDVTKEGAHVTVDHSFNPSTPGAHYLEDPSLKDLDDLPLDVVRFINPADYRVVDAACGTLSMGGAQCHPDIVSTSLLMNRATLSGQFAGGGFIAGTQDKGARYGVIDVVDPYVPAELPDGVVASLDALPSDVPDHVTDPVAAAFYPAYEQLCVECHLYQDGPHKPGLYYSSGCNACHIETSDSSRAETGDITQDLDELGHIKTHRFTNLIPDTQCSRCHISHLGRSLLAIGVRERSEPEGDHVIGGPNRGVEDPEHHVPWAEENYVPHQGRLEMYGKPYPYFIEDEDGTNEVDETPPDVHTAAGMGCIDCHNIREAHGDSNLAERMDEEIDVRCESCHGRPGDRAPLTSDAGLTFNRSVTSVGAFGVNEPVFVENTDGTVSQKVRFTGALHNVTQITDRTDPDHEAHNPRTRMGCELHAGSAERKAALKAEVNALAASSPETVDEAYPGLTEGFTFEVPEQETDGRLECFTCHNAWTVNCYGCHMVRDDREVYTSTITGETKRGKVSSFGLSVVADELAMGFNARERISPMVGTSIFFTHIDENGATEIDAVPLTDGYGNAGHGNLHNPTHHHTIRQAPRDCTGCHPSAEGETDEAKLATAVGLGSGRYTFLDGAGETHWLDRQVAADYDGDGELDDPTGLPLPAQVFEVQPLVNTTHTPAPEVDLGPGPLDLDAINRTLGAVVVDQRPPVEDSDTGTSE